MATSVAEYHSTSDDQGDEDPHEDTEEIPSLSLALPLFPHPEELSTDLPSPSPSFVYEYPVPPQPFSPRAPPSTSLPSRRISHSDINDTCINESSDFTDSHVVRPNPAGLHDSNMVTQIEHIQPFELPETHTDHNQPSDLHDTDTEQPQPYDSSDTQTKRTQPSDRPDIEPCDLPDTKTERSQPSDFLDTDTEHTQLPDFPDTQNAEGQIEHLSLAVIDIKTEHIQIPDLSDEKPESPTLEPESEPDLQSDLINIQTDALLLDRRSNESADVTRSVQKHRDDGISKYMDEDIQMDCYESSVPTTARREPSDDQGSYGDSADILQDHQHPRMIQRHSISGLDHQTETSKTNSISKLSRAKTEPNLITKSKKHRIKPVKPKPNRKPRYRSRSSSPFSNSAFLPRLPASSSSAFPKLPKRYKGSVRRRKVSKDHLSPPTLFPKLTSDAPPSSYPQSLRPPQSPSIFS